mgnify:CR=1 FL=1
MNTNKSANKKEIITHEEKLKSRLEKILQTKILQKIFSRELRMEKKNRELYSIFLRILYYRIRDRIFLIFANPVMYTTGQNY